MGKDRFSNATEKHSKAAKSGVPAKKGTSDFKSSQKRLQQSQKEKLWKSKSSKGSNTSNSKNVDVKKGQAKVYSKKIHDDNSPKMTAKPSSGSGKVTAKPSGKVSAKPSSSGGKSYKPVDKKPAAAVARMELVLTACWIAAFLFRIESYFDSFV